MRTKNPKDEAVAVGERIGQARLPPGRVLDRRIDRPCDYTWLVVGTRRGVSAVTNGYSVYPTGEEPQYSSGRPPLRRAPEAMRSTRSGLAIYVRPKATSSPAPSLIRRAPCSRLIPTFKMREPS